MLRIRKFGENRSVYNAALLEFVDLVLRGFAGIGFRQGYADSAESGENPGKNVLWRSPRQQNENSKRGRRSHKRSCPNPRIAKRSAHQMLDST